DDQRRLTRQLLRDRSSGMKSPPGHDNDLDAARGRFANRQRIFFGELSAAVEQRPVDVHCNQLDRHVSNYTGIGAPAPRPRTNRVPPLWPPAVSSADSWPDAAIHLDPSPSSSALRTHI